MMTAPRMARAGRSKFLICIGILVLISFVAIFHNSQQQLDESRSVSLRCEQNLEALTAQMQVVVSSKLRLEKTIATERMMNEQSKQDVQSRAKEDKEHRDKDLVDKNNRISSLQQMYKLLQSEHDDFKEDCSKVKANNLESINGLERKVKSLQNEVAQLKREREKDVEHWKVKYKQIESEKLSGEEKLSKYDSIIDEYKINCKYTPKGQKHESPSKSIPAVEKSFDAQIPIIPKQMNSDQKNNNNDMNVLQEPPGMQVQKSSTASTGTRKTSEVENKMLAPIALIPAATPENKHKISSTSAKITQLKNPQRSFRDVPLGVVPIQNIPNEFAKHDDTQNEHIESNRYINVIENNDVAAANKESNLNKRDNFQNANEIENGAHEINDNNDFNIDDTKNHRDHLQDVLDDDKINVNNNVINNAAEEDTNIYDNKNENDVDLEIIRKRGHNHNSKYNGGLVVNDKLMNEIAGDQGKAEYPEEMREDLHMEEQAEDEDDDEYGNPGARNQDPAVRN